MSEIVKNNSPDSRRRVWEQGWEDHNRLQLERLARLPLSEKLAWLEEAQRLVRHMRSQQAKSRRHD